MAVSYLWQTIVFLSSVKQARKAAVPLLSLALLASGLNPSAAHQPVLLGNDAAQTAVSPVLVEGSISFAVTANFNRAGQSRHFRFALRAGEQLKLEYLILDRRPENRLKSGQLPAVTITSPSGKKTSMRINERTKFYEPYGKQNYLFLSRINELGEAGIYTVTMRSKARASALVAVGSREIRGEVMAVGSSSETCPVRIENELEVTDSRARQLIGLSERAGELCASLNGWGFRVFHRDGEEFAVTKDYRPNRISIKVVSGKITEVLVG